MPASSSSAFVAPTSMPPRHGARAAKVWVTFILACMAAVGALWWTDGGTREVSHPAETARRTVPLAAASLGSADRAAVVYEGAPAHHSRGITPRIAPLDRGRWTSIVIHHSGTPGGDVASLERRHIQDGLTGLGYHFVIGNGQGCEDGQVTVGYRWDRQLAGAHVAEGGPAREGIPPASYFNEHAVAICLVGNGERRPFTERQWRELVGLVRQLQMELGIPGSVVYLHSQLSGVASPGRFFPADELKSQILP